MFDNLAISSDVPGLAWFWLHFAMGNEHIAVVLVRLVMIVIHFIVTTVVIMVTMTRIRVYNKAVLLW